jgi:hypothetical protein
MAVIRMQCVTIDIGVIWSDIMTIQKIVSTTKKTQGVTIRSVVWTEANYDVNEV